MTSDVAQTLGHTATDSLAMDQLQCFINMDRRTRPLPADYLNFHSPTMAEEMRDNQVRWLADLCEKNGLCEGKWHMAFCRAVEMLDRYIAAAFVDETSLRLLAVVCFFIAYKVDDDNTDIFSSSFLPLLPGCTEQDMLYGELEVLDRLSWAVDRPTPQHFVLMLLLSANEPEKVLASIYHAANQFILLGMADTNIGRRQMSVVGTAAIMCAITLQFSVKRAFATQCRMSQEDWVALVSAITKEHMNADELQAVDETSRLMMTAYYRAMGYDVTQPKQTPDDSGESARRERVVPPTP